EPEAGERKLDLASESVEVDWRAAPDGDSRPSRRLAHLVLDHAGVATERRAKDVRVHSPPVIYEHVVEPALDVGDTSMRGPARAGLRQDRHLVGDLVADQRQHAVEEIRQVDLRGALAGGHRPPVLVDGLDYHQILAQVHSRLLAGDARAAALRHAPDVADAH